MNGDALNADFAEVALTKVALLRDEMCERVRASIKADQEHELRSDAVYVCGALDAILEGVGR